jgi:hypothetical protein
LARAVDGARAADTLDYQAAVEAHRAATMSWQWCVRVANGLNARDIGAYRAVLDEIKPFEELRELGVSVVADELRPGGGALALRPPDELQEIYGLSSR